MEEIKRTLTPVAEWPEALKIGEPVVVAEEPAGTPICFTVIGGKVTSWSSAATVHADVDAAIAAHDMHERLTQVFAGNEAPVHVYTRVLPDSVTVVDCYIGTAETGRWVSDTKIDPNDCTLDDVCAALALPRARVLFRGPWDGEPLDKHTGGPALRWVRMLSVRPEMERVDPERGRVILTNKVGGQ